MRTTSDHRSGDLSATYRLTGVINQRFDVLEQVLPVPIDRESVNAARFIVHLRYFFVRAHDDRQLDDSSERLGEGVWRAFPEAHVAARRLQTVMELRLCEQVSSAELTYLTIHVARLVDDAREGS